MVQMYKNPPKWAKWPVFARYYLQKGWYFCFYFYEIMFPDTFYDIQMSNPFEHYISVSTCSGMMCIACKKSKKNEKIPQNYLLFVW